VKNEMVRFKIDEKVNFSKVGTIEAINKLKLNLLKVGDNLTIKIGENVVPVTFKYILGDAVIFKTLRMKLSEFTI